ncbi:uncharacterized protein CDAR_499181 [Caerostris darwini]|uniref:Uncharacterized protein n=1 Tax=Caerostris darwini TaxID=1538125 RepID=A0AAV4PJK5_9ARAC|nr:uncharacterized protein CDAR_499181 [Caerostris darwini]
MRLPVALVSLVETSESRASFSKNKQGQSLLPCCWATDLPLLVLPTIVTEDYDTRMVLPEEHVSERERMRSLSGGAKGSGSSSRESLSGSLTGRFRRQSGDDAHGKKTNAVFDVFRPRSKSDSKSKRPTFMSSLR